MPRHPRHPAGRRTKTKRHDLEIARNRTAFQNLPTEIVLKIFDFAAAASQRSCLALCRVSSWTRRLALPYLYTAPVLRSTYAANLLGNAIQRTAAYLPEAGYHQSPLTLVRGVWMQDAKKKPRLIPRRFLHDCENLEYIAADDGTLLDLSRSASELPVPLRRGQLRRVTVTGEATAWETITRSVRGSRWRGTAHFLESITNLHFLCAYNTSHQLNTSVFPHLTHLALPITVACLQRSPPPPFLRLSQVLDSSVMQMLVLVVYPKDRRELYRRFDIDGWLGETRRRDPRAFILEQQFSQVKDDWRTEANGGDGVWERAIAFTRGWDAENADHYLYEARPDDTAWRSWKNML